MNISRRTWFIVYVLVFVIVAIVASAAATLFGEPATTIILAVMFVAIGLATWYAIAHHW